MAEITIYYVTNFFYFIGLWGLLKMRICRQHGMRPADLQLFLREYSYRLFHGHHGDVLHRFLRDLAKRDVPPAKDVPLEKKTKGTLQRSFMSPLGKASH